MEKYIYGSKLINGKGTRVLQIRKKQIEQAFLTWIQWNGK